MISIRGKGGNMLKNKSIDYIFGMIIGASLIVAFWACTSNVTALSGDAL